MQILISPIEYLYFSDKCCRDNLLGNIVQLVCFSRDNLFETALQFGLIINFISTTLNIFR